MEIIEAVDIVEIMKRDCDKLLNELKNINNVIRSNKNSLKTIMDSIALRKAEINDLDRLKITINAEIDERNAILTDKKGAIEKLEGSLNHEIAEYKAKSEKLSAKERAMDAERQLMANSQAELTSLIAKHKEKVKIIEGMLK